jgi:hypothetical protein
MVNPFAAPDSRESRRDRALSRFITRLRAELATLESDSADLRRRLAEVTEALVEARLIGDSGSAIEEEAAWSTREVTLARQEAEEARAAALLAELAADEAAQAAADAEHRAVRAERSAAEYRQSSVADAGRIEALTIRLRDAEEKVAKLESSTKVMPLPVNVPFKEVQSGYDVRAVARFMIWAQGSRINPPPTVRFPIASPGVDRSEVDAWVRKAMRHPREVPGTDLRDEFEGTGK